MNSIKSHVKSGFAALLVVILSFGSLPAPQVHAQDIFASSAVRKVIEARRVIRGLGALSLDTLALVRYIGTNASGGTVTVAAGGNITFAQGPVGSSTADASVTCGGGGNGVIVVANAACDTIGEVADVLNATTNWRFIPLESLRSDSSNDTFKVLSETAANTIDGLGLLGDNAVSFKTTLLMNSDDARSMKFYLDSRTRQGTAMRANPFGAPAGQPSAGAGQNPILLLFRSVSTYASGTSTLEIHCVQVTNVAATSGSSETVSTYATAAGATTVATTLDFTPYGLGCPVGQKMLVRINNSAALSASSIYAAGLVY